MLEAFSCQCVVVFCRLGRFLVAEEVSSSSLEVSEPQFLLEAVSCQVWSLSVCLGRVLVAAGGVQLRPRRSQEVRASPELHNGGLRALEETCSLMKAVKAVSVKFRRFLGSWGCLQGWRLRAEGCRLLKAEGWRLETGGLWKEAGDHEALTNQK